MRRRTCDDGGDVCGVRRRHQTRDARAQAGEAFVGERCEDARVVRAIGSSCRARGRLLAVGHSGAALQGLSGDRRVPVLQPVQRAEVMRDERQMQDRRELADDEQQTDDEAQYRQGRGLPPASTRAPADTRSSGAGGLELHAAKQSTGARN